MNTSREHHILSTDKILQKATDIVLSKHRHFPATHLDIGAGSGDLIALLRTKVELASRACDYTSDLMQAPNVHVDVVDLNVEKLPYRDDSFDVVTCTEVIEHLEHYRETLREAYRVLRSGGTFVVSTPNILNLKSRIRFLTYGFYNLFGPLHFKESKLYSTGGHITPIGMFYLIHSLVDSGFHDIEVSIDKRQSTSIFWFLLLYLPIIVFAKITSHSESVKYKTVDHLNKAWVDKMNCFDLLTGRTIIVSAKKYAEIKTDRTKKAA